MGEGQSSSLTTRIISLAVVMPSRTRRMALSCRETKPFSGRLSSCSISLRLAPSADTPAIAGVEAARAASAAVELQPLLRGQAELAQLLVVGGIGRAALGTDAAHQALGDDPAQGARDEIRLHADILQTLDGADGVVRVDGGDDDVARDGRAHGDLRRLAVADLAHADDIRVLAQDGAQAVCEGHAGLLVDGDLVYAVDVVFH